MPERFGNRKTVYNRHRRWSGNGTWEMIMGRLRVGCDETAGQASPRPWRRPEGFPLSDPLGFEWYPFPMEAVIDQAGRIVLPKAIRDALGLLPGTKVDISPYGAGAQIVPAGRTARLVEENGALVAAGETPVDDDMVFALIDAGRK